MATSTVRSSPPHRTTRSEDLVTILFSLWMLIGLFVDAYKHTTDPELETFWTPWHALFYSGFLATSVWFFVITYRRYQPGMRFLDAAPQGYRYAVIGVGLFAAGGIGDAIWHEAFGVETSLDALLSPTHILLFVGGLLIGSAPLRAAWYDWRVKRPSWREFAPALGSLTFTTTIVAFFFEYAWAPANEWIPLQAYDPAGDEFGSVFGVVAIMVSTVILFAPMVLILQRWDPPFGSVTILFVVVNVFIALGFDLDRSGILPALVAGLAADAMLQRNMDRRLVAFATPALHWLTYFFVAGRIDPGLGWPPELWGGSTFFAALAVLGMHLGLEAARRIESNEAATAAG